MTTIAPSPVPSLAALGGNAYALIARHIDHAFRAVLRGPDVVLDRRFTRLITGEPHPFGNFALLTDAADLASTNAAIEPLLHSTAPSAVIYTGPVNTKIAERLNAVGYQPSEAMPAMGVEIDKLVPTSLPDGYAFVRYGSGAEADRWSQAFADGYELPRRVGSEFGPDPAGNVKQSDATLQYFAILKNGQPVCTSLVFLKDGVSGIYGVATLPAERGKGLGAHITAEPLRLVRELGYRVGVLQASPAGHPVYLRLGFKDFGDLPLYLRVPA